ncbi:MAG: hypothetical protein LC637_13535 [Xanthomonadaceae bacterium]|nr:hypothetical protein [Xanthomonadaceae bacterium]
MILVDLNVILDVVQARRPHYQASANVIDRVVSNYEEGALAEHAVTTVHYLVARYRDFKKSSLPAFTPEEYLAFGDIVPE